MASELLSKLTRKATPKTSGTDFFIKEVKKQLGDKPSDVERDGGPSYLPATYNSAAANRERDGVPQTADRNSADANAERDGGRATKSYAKGGSVSASRRGDGIAQRGKTKGRMC